MKGHKLLSHVLLRTLFTKQIALATIENLVGNYRKICNVPFDVASTCLQSH